MRETMDHEALEELRARFSFSVDLRFELFYSLEMLADPGARLHADWLGRARRALPGRAAGRLERIASAPTSMVLLADSLEDLPPTTRYEVVRDALGGLDADLFQLRVLEGALHTRTAAEAVGSGRLCLSDVVAAAPPVKREWLGHIGLYPFDAATPMARWLESLCRDPESAKRELVELLDDYVDAVFTDAWSALRPRLQRSIAERERLFHSCDLEEFLHRALIRIELDQGRAVFRALRGAFELPFDRLGIAHLSASAFNRHRYWTSYQFPERPWVAYIPCFDPGVALDAPPHAASDPTPRAERSPVPDWDLALICKALGDTTRFAIASLIARQPHSSAELAAKLSVSRPTISHHVFLLRQAGLLEEQTRGNSTYLRLRRDAFENLTNVAIQGLFPEEAP